METQQVVNARLRIMRKDKKLQQVVNARLWGGTSLLLLWERGKQEEGRKWTKKYFSRSTFILKKYRNSKKTL